MHIFGCVTYGEEGGLGPAEVVPRRRGSVRVCGLCGIELRLHWTWTIIAVLLTTSIATLGLPVLEPHWPPLRRWLVAAAVALLFFASLVAHELSHSLMARRRGIPVENITLFLFGGVSSLSEEPRRANDEFWVAVVGPLASFGLMVAFAALWGLAAWAGAETLATTFFYVALVNFMVGAFNLLPGYPLDGGRILRSAVWRFRRSHGKASAFAGVVGKIVASGLVALGAFLLVSGALGGLWLAFLGIFVWTAGVLERRAEQSSS